MSSWAGDPRALSRDGDASPSRNELPEAAKKSVENGQETGADSGARMIAHANTSEDHSKKADKVTKLGGPVSLSQILSKPKISPPKIVPTSPIVTTSVYKPQMGNGASCFGSEQALLGNSVAGSSPTVTATGVRPSVAEFEKKGGGTYTLDDVSAKDKKIEQLELEVLELKIQLKRKDDQNTKLEKEVHQLKSVLEVTQLSRMDTSTSQKTELTKQKAAHLSVNLTKRQGVSGESSEQTRTTATWSTPPQLQQHDKDFRTKQLIKDALMENDFLKNLDTGQVKEIVDFMYPCKFEAEKYVIREGDQGSHLYVLAEGELDVEQAGYKLRSMGPGKAFGELAILYNCTRTASVKAVTPSLIWALDRRVFQHVMKRTGLKRIDDNLFFLKSVPLLARLSPGNLYKLASVLEQEFFSEGTYIIRQGTRGDCFYIIASGKVKVTQKASADSKEEVEIRELERGDYFGEQALLKDDVRTANIVALAPGVECLAIDRESFVQLIGDLSELKEKSYNDGISRSTSQSSDTVTPSSPTAFTLEAIAEFTSIQLHDLEIIATLGIGGFGRVELVVNSKDRSQCFALKCLKKQHIIQTQQQEHIYNEKVIMMSCRSSFVARLFNTYKDRKYAYMLMEPCLGGEVWSILRDRTHFDDSTSQFYTACVVEAFDYLHSRGIIYRDLKPENLLLDSHGYVKLVDFGFSKRLGVSGKTWTFCGTPEYVAPEVILNKGHDRAVDYWSVGILMYELLTGTPPFVSTDPMKTYNLILRGLEQIEFPRTVGRQANNLIKRFCRELPSERLGYQRGGIEDIRKHRWFLGFDWDGLRSKSLRAPIQPVVRGPTDAGNFDIYPRETELPPDETSGWDTDF